MDSCSAEEVQTGDRDQNGQYGDDGTSQHLIGGEVDDLVKIELLMFAHIFANTVKDNHRFIHGVTYNRKNGS